MASRSVPYAVGIALSLALLLFALLVPPGHAPWIPCGFLLLTGYPCPFCGTTRALTAAGHGQWHAAIHESPMGAALLPLAAVMLVWCVWRLVRVRREPLRTEPVRIPRWLAIAVTFAVLANWVYRLAEGLK